AMPAPAPTEPSAVMNGGRDHPDASAGIAGSNVLLINASKHDAFGPNYGFKTLTRKLKSSWKIVSLKDEVTESRLSEARIFLVALPNEKFSVSEFDAMKAYLAKGGSILVLMGEGGESRFDTNVNFFLEELGISVNSDCVVRTAYYKYFHPKECYVPNGVLNRAISEAAGKALPPMIAGIGGNGDSSSVHKSSLHFVYPYGATLNVAKPAVAVLSTGSVAFPLNRPVCAFANAAAAAASAAPASSSRAAGSGGGGKVAVFGAAAAFSDEYIDKEDNFKLLEVLLQYLSSDSLQLNAIDAEEPEVADYQHAPDIEALSEELKACLQESDDVPKDVLSLYDSSLYVMDTSLVPKAIAAYDKLRVKHEQLSLIQPQFETPLPPLQPAVFPPSFRELPAPALELFDLDEQFSTEKVRLAQITNKCTDEDLEYYVRQCGEILGVTNKLPADKRDAKAILAHVLAQVAEFKKINQD
ncbi:hypothetical protein BOX15_Mlig001340g7, partial [Macrostomum lignano]